MKNFQIPYCEIEQQFVKFMAENDVLPKEDISWSVDAVPAINFLVVDGHIHRYQVECDKRGQRSGAYCVWADGWPCGWVQDWRKGEAIRWKFERSKLNDKNLAQSLTAEKIKAMEDLSRQHQEELKKKHEEFQAEAAEKARIMFDSLSPCDESDHPYLLRKNVLAYGLHVNKKNKMLAIPLRNIDGQIMSLQWISADGLKKFFPGAPVLGNFARVALDLLDDEEYKSRPILVCEGYATMATVYALTGCPCVAAMSCNNLLPVASALKDKYPGCRMLIIADNDHSTENNPGITAAQSAVSKLNLPVCISPEFTAEETGTDWNDYYLLHGEENARQRLRFLIREALMTPEQKAERDRQEKLKPLITNLDPNIQIAPQEFIGGMFPRKFVSALVAQSGIGKTMFMQKFVSDLSIGGSIFDGFTDNEPERMCLIFAGEAGYELMLRRGAQTKWRIYPPRVKVVDSHKMEINDVSVMLDDPDGWTNIKSIVNICEPDIIFFDSLVSFHEKDENKAAEMKPIFKKLDSLAREKNCAIVLIHHSRKRTAKERTLSLNQDDVIGSSVFNRLVGLIIGIEPMKEDEKTLLVRTLKTWFSAFMPFTYRITESADGRTIMETDLAPATVNNSRIAVWNYLVSTFEPDEWFSFSQIILSEINPNVTEWQLRRIITGFVNSGKLHRRGATKSLEYSRQGYSLDIEGE